MQRYSGLEFLLKSAKFSQTILFKVYQPSMLRTNFKTFFYVTIPPNQRATKKIKFEYGLWGRKATDSTT